MRRHPASIPPNRLRTGCRVRLDRPHHVSARMDRLPQRPLPHLSPRPLLARLLPRSHNGSPSIRLHRQEVPLDQAPRPLEAPGTAKQPHQRSILTLGALLFLTLLAAHNRITTHRPAQQTRQGAPIPSERLFLPPTLPSGSPWHGRQVAERGCFHEASRVPTPPPQARPQNVTQGSTHPRAPAQTPSRSPGCPPMIARRHPPRPHTRPSLLPSGSSLSLLHTLANLFS